MTVTIPWEKMAPVGGPAAGLQAAAEHSRSWGQSMINPTPGRQGTIVHTQYMAAGSCLVHLHTIMSKDTVLRVSLQNLQVGTCFC